MTGKIPVTKSGKRKQYRSPEAIARRNDQERARQAEMNDAFDNLRKVIPNGEWKGKKKSKCETLQGAIEHIENLLELLTTPEVQNYDQTYTNNYSSPTSSLDQSGYSYGSSGYWSPNSSLQEQTCFQQTPQQASPTYQPFGQFMQTTLPFSEISFLPTEEDTLLPPLVSTASTRYSPY
ncbi:unnamed protein product [Oikopleura dioica]|uniref:BHLH domain-containing protein n=1 Tax=Oikopleura dioica TaxID=34765 RepID=E4WSH0_OIKDI|nr:unnamed protein product [Oikopleura dioica]